MNSFVDLHGARMVYAHHYRMYPNQAIVWKGGDELIFYDDWQEPKRKQFAPLVLHSYKSAKRMAKQWNMEELNPELYQDEDEG